MGGAKQQSNDLKFIELNRKALASLKITPICKIQYNDKM
jgi:hypothetical protein